jgi:CheY-like chemotaxis protein
MADITILFAARNKAARYSLEVIAPENAIIDTVLGGHALLAAYEFGKYGLIVVDSETSSPGISGLEAVEKIRRRDEEVKIWVVGDTTSREEAMSAGANEFYERSSPKITFALERLCQGLSG